jgi:hypothetical protein
MSFALKLLVTALVVSVAQHAYAQQSIKDQIVGAWAFETSNAKRADGTPLWGEAPRGMFILSPSGHFSWQVFRSDRPPFASKNRLTPTSDEVMASNGGSLAYFGTYLIDEAEKMITFRTIASTFPNAEGEVIKRVITKLTPDELVYANPSTTLGQSINAVFKRAK